MADFKTKYPNSSTVLMTMGLSGLINDTTTGITGRESTEVDNSTNLDIDHLLSGIITTGSAPSAGSTIEIWVYAPIRISTGIATYPDVIVGTDGQRTFTNRNVLLNCLKPVTSLVVASDSYRTYPFGPFSVGSLFGFSLPRKWGAFVVNRTGAYLDFNSINHYVHYERIQSQSV